MRLSVLKQIAVLVVLAYLSFLLAIFGAFLVPTTLVAGVSVGVVIAVVGNFVLATQGRRATGSAVGAVLPALVWLVVALALAGGRREGDVVLTTSVSSLAYLLLGALSAAVAIGRRPSPPADEPGVAHED